MAQLPELEIELTTEELGYLSWDDEGGDYLLEMSHDLKIWLPVPAPPTVLDDTFRVPMTTAPDQGFFRLRGTYPSLFVVNASDDLTSFANFTTARGNVSPTTRLEIGVATGLTQPRTVVVTRSGRLLVGRGNGGIVGWNNATAADGKVVADVVVDGEATGLTQPIAFAYDWDADRLFVGNTLTDRGILVFDDVSSSGFKGDLAPNRTFGPDDRVPFNEAATTIGMTIDAFMLDDGTLYVVDTSGGHVNSSRILVFDSPSSANGKTNPVRTLSGPWTKLRSIHIEDGRLYAVDDTEVLFLVDDIDTADGLVNPTQVTVERDHVKLREVQAFDGQLYFLDENNASILAFEEILDGKDKSVIPDRVIDGSATKLRLPTNLFIAHGALLDP